MKKPNPYQSIINQLEAIAHTLPDTQPDDAPRMAITGDGLTVRFRPTRAAAAAVLAKLYKPLKKPRRPIDTKREFRCVGGPFDGARIWLTVDGGGDAATLPFNGGRYVGGWHRGAVNWHVPI